MQVKYMRKQPLIKLQVLLNDYCNLNLNNKNQQELLVSIYKQKQKQMQAQHEQHN